jgi:HAD superfamily hydrolase (TIGR01450 family)
MRPVRASLASSARPLAEAYDVALLDLDGVVYIGSDAVDGAPDALAATRAAGMRLAFVTNNAARTPEAVAQHLTELGIDAAADEVVTSAQAAAHSLADRLPAGAQVLVVGTSGLEAALRERGLVPVAEAVDEVAAVVQGYSPDLSWRQLAEGAVAINRGLPWVATNLDPTVPSARGRLPGNGALVAALRHATGVEPVATGKPDPTMHRESVQRSGAANPIVVGDRLDTDVEGANAVGCASLLVLTGVTSPAELLAASPKLRPSFVAADLAGLLQPHPAPVDTGEGVTCGHWLASVESGRLTLRARGGHAPDGDEASVRSANGDDLDALRALCVAAWSTDGAAKGTVAAGGEDAAQRRTAEEVLARLGLADSSATDRSAAD